MKKDQLGFFFLRPEKMIWRAYHNYNVEETGCRVHLPFWCGIVLFIVWIVVYL